jgi:hypothetical protein
MFFDNPIIFKDVRKTKHVGKNENMVMPEGIVVLPSSNNIKNNEQKITTTMIDDDSGSTNATGIFLL